MPMQSRGRGGGNVVFGRSSEAGAKPKAAPMPQMASRQRLSEQRFDKHKAANPFASKAVKHKTGFASSFSAGGMPVRINHASGVKQALTWSLPLEQLNYDPLLLTFFEGLCETEHPYVFVAREGIKDLLEAPGATQKTVPLVVRTARLRTTFLSLGSHTDSPTAVVVGRVRWCRCCGRRCCPRRRGCSTRRSSPSPSSPRSAHTQPPHSPALCP